MTSVFPAVAGAAACASCSENSTTSGGRKGRHQNYSVASGDFVSSPANFCHLLSSFVGYFDAFPDTNYIGHFHHASHRNTESKGQIPIWWKTDIGTILVDIPLFVVG